MDDFLAKDEEVDGHAHADEGEDESQDDCAAGASAGLPGAGAELANEDEVLDDRGDEDDDSERDQGHA